MSDWRHQTLQRMRTLIHDAHPDIVEQVEWLKPSNPAGVPTWTCDGIVRTGELYKDTVERTFPRGAPVRDPDGIFNASPEARDGRSTSTGATTSTPARSRHSFGGQRS